ncbi:MAG TPA: FGGY-family carbohydrate kinase [Polyangiaceae bacterium]|jgi:FGGY-family pentulose kinase|nr:FGGY-family carbohydrate kinase [Polyangiaceae bacterium]
MARRHYLGIDVGTASARAAIFDPAGVRVGMGTHPLAIFRPAEDHVEQSSEDIWRAAGLATRAALTEWGGDAAEIAGVGFDATCSLVALDDADAPVSVSVTGAPEQNVVMWMDHRAVAEARRINQLGHEVLRYVGGTISPEMQTPKLLWLKEHLPAAWQRARRFLDLPDFLTYRATGLDVRSLCSTTCKWTYLGDGAGGGVSGFRDDYFRGAGLGDLVDEGYARIGTKIGPMGERIGTLTPRSAKELGLLPGTAVGVSIIDAHAGGLGLLGVTLSGATLSEAGLEERLALIGGTSSCHMAVSREPRFPPGIWGPYYSAMLPGLWLTEGGQSATGALIEHVIDAHARGAELRESARREGTSVYSLLNDVVERLAAGRPFPAALTEELHVLPYFHGNRSPRADPTLRGMISGLKLTDSVESLALVYLATVQAIAHGTRHIVDTMNAAGFRISTIVACGGDTKNPLFVREHADATGCHVVLPREPEAVLLGAAILGAVASGDQPSVLAAMSSMSASGGEVAPPSNAVRDYHARKHRVFERMYADQIAYRELMAERED